MTKEAQIKNLKAIILTQERDIGHLSKVNRLQEERIERLSKRNQELVAIEEDAFLHSPTYLRMKDEITILTNRLRDISFEKE